MLTGVLEVGLFYQMTEAGAPSLMSCPSPCPAYDACTAYFGRSHPEAQVLVKWHDGRQETLRDADLKA
jgi:hypothetical protein